MTLDCQTCGKPYEVPPSHAAKRRTCSRECMGKQKSLECSLGVGGGYFRPGHPQYNTGRTHFRKGDKPSELSIKNARIARDKKYKGKPNPSRQGSNCHLWKGGITPQNHALRTSLEFVNWRRWVFERDNYTCQKCGARNGDGKTHELHAHHIKQFARFPELRFEISNGLTLCKNCHIKGEHNGK